MTKPRDTRKRPGNTAKKVQQPALWGKDTLVIDRMSQEGRGVASRGGKIVFVSGALPGEQVRAQCAAVKRDFDEADMIELLTDTAPSTQRVTPECLIYHLCGGCNLQHWSLAAQQQHKQENLSAMLQAIVPTFVIDPPLTAQSTGFRHRLRLLVTRNSDRNYVLGLRQRRSHSSVDVRHCLVANAALNQVLQDLPGKLLRGPDLQGLREIEIDSDSNNQVGLCFYFAAHPGEKTIAALHTAMFGKAVMALRVCLQTQRQTRNAVQLEEPEAENLSQWQELYAAGELIQTLKRPVAHGTSTTNDLQLAYLPGDFTQTHWEINAALVARAIEWLRPRSDEVALDLFSGSGNFSLPLALGTKTVHALEGDGGMTTRIIDNAERNGIENVSAKTLNLMTDEVVLPKADIAIVDPPRAGAKAVCAALARSKVKRLLYVSCHPATLLRDARVLHGAGLRLTKAAVVDMFPHTGHSEAIVLFERR